MHMGTNIHVNRLFNFLKSRLRLFFSIEFAFVLAMNLFLFKLPIVAKWISPPLDFSVGMETVLKQIEHYNNMEYLRSFIVITLTMVLVYGMGEVIRRKFKLKSIFFDNDKK